jgi:hypothetical protein
MFILQLRKPTTYFLHGTFVVTYATSSPHMQPASLPAPAIDPIPKARTP